MFVKVCKELFPPTKKKNHHFLPSFIKLKRGFRLFLGVSEVPSMQNRALTGLKSACFERCKSGVCQKKRFLTAFFFLALKMKKQAMTLNQFNTFRCNSWIKPHEWQDSLLSVAGLSRKSPGDYCKNSAPFLDFCRIIPEKPSRFLLHILHFIPSFSA